MSSVSSASTGSLPSNSFPITKAGQATDFLFQKIIDRSLNKDCFLELLQNGADINAFDFYGNTPLHIAVKCNNTYAVKLLLEAKADIEAAKFSTYETPLYTAVQQNHEEAALLLINYKANVNALNINTDSPLHAAARNSNLWLVEKLISCGAACYANMQGKTPLSIAAENIYSLTSEEISANSLAAVNYRKIKAVLEEAFSNFQDK